MAETSVEKTSGAIGGAGGWFGRVQRFFAEVRNEMGRVTWPSRREVYATTIVVILFSTLVGIYLFFVDLGLSSGIGWIFRRFGA